MADIAPRLGAIDFGAVTRWFCLLASDVNRKLRTEIKLYRVGSIVTVADTIEGNMSIVAFVEDFESVVEWLMGQARLISEPELLLDELCRRLRSHGMPVEYMRWSTQTVHPLAAAWGATWRNNGGSRVWQRAFQCELDNLNTEAEEISPARSLRETGMPVRHRIKRDTPNQSALFKSFAEMGYTDYVAVKIDIADATFAFCSFLTASPSGWSQREILHIKTLVAFLAPALEVINLRHVSKAVLETYLGPRYGLKVLQGYLKRGAVDQVEAVVLYSDLREFTYIASNLNSLGTIDLLDDYFTIIENAVSAEGGEVLQFVGDAAVAVFLIEKGDFANAIERALRAAAAATTLAEKVNIRRVALNLPWIAFGIGITLGDLTIGNVGSPTRLGFNAIGPCVNQAARIESLTKALNLPVLLSEGAARKALVQVQRVGSFTLKGTSGLQDVYAPVKLD